MTLVSRTAIRLIAVVFPVWDACKIAQCTVSLISLGLSQGVILFIFYISFMGWGQGVLYYRPPHGKPVVLNLGSMKLQGFSESVSARGSAARDFEQ